MTEEERPLRLFVAVDVPLDRRLLLHDAIEPHRAAFPAARWITPESQHITLKFLGKTSQSSMQGLDDALSAVASGGRSGRLALGGLGVFPSRARARVLWAGVSDPELVLTKLASALDVALEDMGYGIEKRSYAPHLTLARFKVPVRVDDPLPELPKGHSLPFELDRIVLYSSRLHPHGARYEPVGTYELGGGSERRA